MTKRTKEAAPQAAEPVVEPKALKVPKPIAFSPGGDVKATKAGSKLSILIDRLSQQGGVTLDDLAAALSATGSKVDAAGVRSWISYDLRRVGLGCHQEGDRLFLVGTPLPHKVTEPKKAPEAKKADEQKVEPQLKKAAGSSKPKSKKGKKAAAA